MQTLKTAVVVVLLLAGLYGAYVVLNQPEDVSPEQLGWQQEATLEPPEIDFSSGAENLEPTGPPVMSFDSVPPIAGTSEARDLGMGPLPQVAATEPQIANDSRARFPVSASAEGLSAKFPASEAAPSSHYAAGAAAASHPSSTLAVDGSTSSSGSAPGVQRNPYVDGDLTAASGAPATSSPSSTESTGVETPSSAALDAARKLGSTAFGRAWKSAQSQISNGQWQEALFTLSIFYKSPDLLPEQQQQLLDLLDPLAGKVIYSDEHLLEAPYRVRRSETLMDIAERYNVPWQLLRNINDIDNPEILIPGSEIKVVPGPFRAEVDLQQRELTLFVGRLYAGRFPITVGSDPQPEPGDYQVRDKQTERSYFAADGQTYTSDDPKNPFAGCWIDLGNQLSIHGSAEQAAPNAPGCISLSPIDAQDVYGILSQGSKVTIRR